MGLIAAGTVILNAKTLGVSSEGKILLKTVHVYIGYVFFADLTWRIVWDFIGSHFAKWRMILPFGWQYCIELVDYIADLKNGKPTKAYLGHNPIARLMVTLLLLSLIVHVLAVVVTGLKERNSLVSAIFTGSKVFKGKPVDLE